jgi:arylsulfatase A-like enzyme
MNRIALLLCGILLCLPRLAPAAEAPPNLVIILADDLGYADVGFDGRSEWTTPHLDAMARQGTVFRRWYTGSPICLSSRAALMTRRYGIHNGLIGNASLDLPASEVTIAQALEPHGYATALFGKWHAGPKRPGEKTWIHPLDRGFDEFFGFTNATHAWQKFPTELWEGREMKPSHGYADDLFTDRAIDFIKRQKGHPFFLYVPFICPHGKPDAPPEEIAKFKDKFTGDADAETDRIYAAEITRMDEEVGRIIKTLDDLDLSKKTLVVFTSDHGATFEKLSKFAPIDLDSNRPFRGQKRTLWEGGLRVPAIVRWPGQVPAGSESHVNMIMTDVFPTFLAAAGVTADPKLKLDGVNMLDVWRGKSKGPDRTLYWNWDESGRVQFAAMHGDLKMVINSQNKPELYDVAQDPAERLDRAEQFPEELKKLKKGLDEWFATESPAAKERRHPSKKAAKAEAQGKD